MHIITRIDSPFIFIAEEYLFVLISIISLHNDTRIGLSILPSIDRHLGCLKVWVTMSKTAVKFLYLSFCRQVTTFIYKY